MSAEIPSYDDLVWCCSNLCDLIEVENEALAAHDPETVKALADNKAALARMYEQAVIPMVDEPALVETLEPGQKEELAALVQRLKGLVEDNSKWLRAEMEACQRLMDVMVSAVKTNATDKVTYTQTGTYGMQGNEKNSLAFNQKL